MVSQLTEAMIVNGVVLATVLASDVGPARKIGRMRLLRPVIAAAVIIPIFMDHPATHGNGLAVEIAGIAAGVLGGLGAAALMRVYRSPATGKPVSSAGVAVRDLLDRRHRRAGRLLLRRRPLVHRLDRGLGNRQPGRRRRPSPTGSSSWPSSWSSSAPRGSPPARPACRGPLSPPPRTSLGSAEGGRGPRRDHDGTLVGERRWAGPPPAMPGSRRPRRWPGRGRGPSARPRPGWTCTPPCRSRSAAGRTR